MADEKAIDRLRKLLNMTEENGCSKDEAETARKMAEAAADRLKIDINTILPKDAPKRKATAKYKSEELKPHQALCAQAAATLYGIECNVYNLGAQGIMFVGREELIEVAEETMFWLFRQVEELYKQALPRGLTQRARAEFRKTFKAACALRVSQRADALIRDFKTNTQSAQQATGHNALVVAGHFETLSKECDDYWTERFKLSPEQQQRIEDRSKREEERRAALTPVEREREDKKLETERKREERKAAKRKGRAGRSLPWGSGSDAGLAAGNNVKLRKELG